MFGKAVQNAFQLKMYENEIISCFLIFFDIFKIFLMLAHQNTKKSINLMFFQVKNTLNNRLNQKNKHIL